MVMKCCCPPQVSVMCKKALNQNFVRPSDNFVLELLTTVPFTGYYMWMIVGKDATDDFVDVGHSSTARAMMDEFYVGEIDTSTVPTKTEYTPPKQPHYNQDKTLEFMIKLLQFLVPLLILGLAVGVRFYTNST